MIYIATYARKLKDKSGNYISPATRASCVYMSDNTTLEERVLSMYPLGSVYQSFEDTSPASIFGGEWEKLENTFLYGSGTKTLGDTGGEETHQLTLNELAEHTHLLATGTGGGNFVFPAWASPNAIGGPSKDFSSNAATTGYVNGTTKNQPHNNMPPYTVINIWRRVS